MNGFTGRARSRYENSARLLVDEERHRTANELAAALAALRLTKARLDCDAPMIDEAIARIEGHARLNRLLVQPPSEGNNASEALRELCEAFVMGRSSLGERNVRLVLEEVVVHPGTLDALLQVAYELLINATKHGEPTSGKIAIHLRRLATSVALEVVNETPGQSNARRGAGAALVSSILRRAGGDLRITNEGQLYRAVVVLPDGFRRIEGPRRGLKP